MSKQPEREAEEVVEVKPLALPEPPKADPNKGLGGSYRKDPKTGRRELVSRTVIPR